MRTLADVFPNVEILLTLEPGEIGAALMELWESITDDRSDKRVIGSFLHGVYGPGSRAVYPNNSQDQVALVLAEGWAWLERQGLIVREPGSTVTPWFLRTRRGRQFKTRADVAAYRNAEILPRELLHPKIVEKAWSLFMRGDYEVAVLQALIAIEIAVRDAGDHDADLVGVELMRAAFHSDSGTLADQELVTSERQALSHLFAGVFGAIRNPLSHRETKVQVLEAAQLLIFTSYLMRIVESRHVHRLLS